MTDRLRLIAWCGLTLVLAASSACGGAAKPSSAEGRSLYGENGCANCHGPAGHGDGPVAKTLVPRPRDFRDAAAFKNGIDVSAIAKTLADGLATNGAAMPRFNHLTERERRSLALFVTSLHEHVTGGTDQ
jgi:high-affinity iron transporter